MNIFLTGSSGFIGSVVKNALQEHNLVLYAKQPVPPLERLIETISGSDIIVHLAGGGGTKECTAHPYDALDNNLLLTSRLVEAARQCRVKQFVFVSSIAVYCTYKQRENPLFEKTQPQPDEFYGLIKLCCEERMKDIPYTILRLGNVYGYGTGTNLQKGGFINNVCLNLAKKQSIVLQNRDIQMDFIHVSDVVLAIKRALDNLKATYEVINVGSGYGISLEKVATIIAAKTSVPIVVEDKPTYAPRWMDITKARELLAWTPTISLEQGIDELIMAQKKQ